MPHEGHPRNMIQIGPLHLLFEYIKGVIGPLHFPKVLLFNTYILKHKHFLIFYSKLRKNIPVIPQGMIKNITTCICKRKTILSEFP